MSYLGDFVAGDTIDFAFTTRNFSTGAPFALTGGTVSVYKGNSTTESVAGVTLTPNFDAVTGLNHIRITTGSDGTFYSNGSQFRCVITAGTVNGVSVVGEIVAWFTIRAQAALYPVTAGRQLAVDANSRVDLGAWLGVAMNALIAGRVDTNPGALQNNIITAAAINAGAITNGKFGAGAIDATVLATDTITAAKVAADVTPEIQAGLATATGLTAVQTAIMTELQGANIEGILTTISGIVSGISAATTPAIAQIKARTDAIPTTVDTLSLQDALTLMVAVLLAKSTGFGTATVNYRNIGDTKNRIVATVDSQGNRTAITRDAT